MTSPKKAKKAGISGFRAVVMTVGAIAALLVVNTLLFWHTRVVWPVFPSEQPAVTQPQDPSQPPLPVKAPDEKEPPLLPEVKVEIDRDFAYRIGDPVPVVLYIKQKAGTLVDLHSIALDGNFEIRSNGAQAYVEDLPDGSKRMRYVMELQSFSNAPKLGAKAAISYRVLETNDDYTVYLPAIEVYTSNTWDGRDLIKEGKLGYEQGYHLWFNGALFLVGLIGAYCSWRLYRRYKLMMPELLPAARKAKRFVLARIRFDAVWAKIMAGDRQAENYVEIERIVRTLYEIEAKTTREASYWFLYGNRGPYQAVEILHLCDKVIYLREALTDEEHAEIKRVFDKLVPHYTAEVIAEATEIVASPSERRKMREEKPERFGGPNKAAKDDAEALADDE